MKLLMKVKNQKKKNHTCSLCLPAQKDFLNQLGKTAFGEFRPEEKQIIYNAGLSGSQTSAGSTSVTSVFMLYLMGQRQLSLSQIAELSDEQKKKYGKEP